MATRSLGSLTIDLLMRTGAFTQGWTAAERVADRAQRKIAADARKRAKETRDAWKGAAESVGNLIGGAIAGITVGAVFQKFIAETVQAQKEQAGLAAALKATGNAAGFSLGRLNEMAGAMEAATGIAAGELNQAQKVLTGFTNIVGEEYAKALQAAADYSAYTGQSMVASAELMGRALNIPSVGMASLSKQGFKFTEEQIKLARSLEETGRIAEAQKLVLDELEMTYGGAAVAARDTLGGAMSALKNTINALMTGEGGSVDGLTKAVNDLAATVGSESVRSAFQSLTTWIAETANTAANAATRIVQAGELIKNSSFWGWLQVGAKDSDNLTGSIEETERKIANLQKTVTSMSRPLHRWWNADDIVIANGQISTLQSKLQGLYALRDQRMKSAVAGLPPAGESDFLAPDLSPARVGPIKLKDGTGGKGGKSQTQRDAEAAEKYLQALRETALARNNLNNYEKLALDIETGKVTMTDRQLEQAKELAILADERVFAGKQQAESISYLAGIYDEARSLAEAVQTPTEKWIKQVERLNELSAAGVLDQETYARTVKKYYKDLTEETDSFALNFQKNVQDMIGNSLVDGLRGSFKDIAANFLKMLLQMEAQAAAANFMRLFTGEGSVTSSPLTGLLSKLAGSLFGGFRASGGPVSGGSLYRVNELGPELLSYGGSDYLMMGGSGGYVKPLGAADTKPRGAGNITVVNQTTGRVDNVEQRQLTHDDVVLIIQEQTPKVMVSQTQNANSPFSRTMTGSFNMSRRR